MNQPLQAQMPFFETAEDATYSAILRSGKPPKAVAHALWPHTKPDSAYARLMGALKADRPEKLTSDEHLFIANHTGEYDWLYYAAQQCNHSRPEPVEPEDQEAELRRIFVQSVSDLQVLASRLKANGVGR